MLINVSLKAFNELFPFSWRGNMHFRKAYLLLFQVRCSLLPLCKYLVRNKFFNNLGQFLWFWGTVCKKILINSVFVLFQPESLDNLALNLRNILSQKCFLVTPIHSGPGCFKVKSCTIIYANCMPFSQHDLKSMDFWRQNIFFLKS